MNKTNKEQDDAFFNKTQRNIAQAQNSNILRNEIFHDSGLGKLSKKLDGLIEMVQKLIDNNGE